MGTDYGEVMGVTPSGRIMTLACAHDHYATCTKPNVCECQCHEDDRNYPNGEGAYDKEVDDGPERRTDP